MTSRSSVIAVFAGLALMVCACGDDGPTAAYTYALVEAFPNLSFSRPVDIRHAGDGSNRLFVVEQAGVIRVFENVDTVSTSSVFLDITASVSYTPQSELGLLGLAFHPDYAANGWFYVYYTTGPATDRRSRLCRFTVSGDPDAADPFSERLLLEFPQPYDNHNGGGMCFDGDGYLCLGLGDGGSGGDPLGNGQNTATPLGSILRLDVNQNAGVPPFHGIPADNPFVGGGGRAEIFAWGFRNPWRIAYDAPGGRLWVGDVGQANFEEIDVVTGAGNYGWDCREGLHPYNTSGVCASVTGLIDPVFEYTHADGRSITGGYVYRGPTLTSLTGRYVYADYVGANYAGGTIWALKNVVPAQTEVLLDTSHFISTFGVDEDGELLVAGYFAAGDPSKIYRITRTEVQP